MFSTPSGLSQIQRSECSAAHAALPYPIRTPRPLGFVNLRGAAPDPVAAVIAEWQLSVSLVNPLKMTSYFLRENCSV